MCTNFLKFLVLIWLNLGFTLLHTTNDNNNTKKKSLLFPSFFYFIFLAPQNLWGKWVSDHPQEDLAKFGLKIKNLASTFTSFKPILIIIVIEILYFLFPKNLNLKKKSAFLKII